MSEKIKLKCPECGEINTFHIEGIRTETFLNGSKYHLSMNLEKELICGNCGTQLQINGE